jgi:hypothetical protein
VEDDLGAADRVVDALVAPQLALDEVDVVVDLGQVRPVPGREVVEYPDLVAALEQRPDEVRADEARSTGDERLHASATTW